SLRRPVGDLDDPVALDGYAQVGLQRPGAHVEQADIGQMDAVQGILATVCGARGHPDARSGSTWPEVTRGWPSPRQLGIIDRLRSIGGWLSRYGAYLGNRPSARA